MARRIAVTWPQAEAAVIEQKWATPLGLTFNEWVHSLVRRETGLVPKIEVKCKGELPGQVTFPICCECKLPFTPLSDTVVCDDCIHIKARKEAERQVVEGMGVNLLSPPPPAEPGEVRGIESILDDGPFTPPPQPTSVPIPDIEIIEELPPPAPSKHGPEYDSHDAEIDRLMKEASSGPADDPF